MRPIPELEDLARRLIGDGKEPDLFFVTRDGAVCAVFRNYEDAHAKWLGLANVAGGRIPCELENRTFGVICSQNYLTGVDLEDGEKPRWERVDHGHLFEQSRRARERGTTKLT
jgi:hypothetical protein